MNRNAMMLITTNTIHIPVEAAAAAAMTCWTNGLGQTSAFDRVPALAARCAP
jgi:hypothetical protein